MTMDLPRNAYSWPPASVRPAMTPPLTPPEKNGFSWNVSSNYATLNPGLITTSLEGEQTMPAIPTGQSSSQTVRPSNIQLPSGESFSRRSDPGTWLSRALRNLGTGASQGRTCPHLQVVVQAMPGHEAEMPGREKPVFEDVVTTLQESMPNGPHVSITHAYTSRQDVSLKNAPVSPPATPNVFEGDDYFNSQTIFTNIARIRDYHTKAEEGHNNAHVAPPGSVHASVLERYVPPTTRQEVQDFFSVSKQSYLLDRLCELHDGTWGPNGALLLVYPTLSGGKTFKTYYKDPVMDPLLRRFMMLRGLTTRAGEALGKMDAIEALLEFDDMQVAIEKLCHELESRRWQQGRSHRFTIEHAEKTDIVLDRQTWIQQFLAQEGSRMKQDLIEYQKSGQRMPTSGFEASPAALAREVEDGIKNSTTPAGGIGIEMGVFVIRRSLII